MNYNIIDQYIGFLRKSYLELFKILFKDQEKKEMYLNFIDRYLNVRYYNDTNYPAVKDFMNRINKELIDVVKKNANDDNIDSLKNIVAVFGYLIYFDDINYVVEEVNLIDSLINDGIIKISNKKELKKKIKEWLSKHNKTKELFNSTIETKDFNIIEKRLYRKLYDVELGYNVKISNLYSEYAIDKAYNSGIINEDKAFITYILTSSLVLSNAINLDFTRHYMVPLPSTLLSKDKKRSRLLSILDNNLAKRFICIKITYKDYMKNKKMVNDLINKGYFFGIELDSSFKGSITELFLFPYILVYEDSEEYEMLVREKEHLKSKIIKL